MNEIELNDIVKAIELAFRQNHSCHSCRIRQINPSEIREIMLRNKIGLQCEKCLTKKYSGKYCSKEHSEYYTKISFMFYGSNKPFGEIPKECPLCNKQIQNESIDHIKPIANGGLEFDRGNLQYACLKCNIQKSGGKRYIDRISQTKITNFVKA